MNKKYSIDMTSGSIAGKILLFTIPLMASSILQLLFNAADIVVVGKFAGDDALAAVGSNGALINLMTNLFLGLSVGGNVVTAKHLGAGDNEGTHKSVHTSMTIAFMSGLVLTIIGVIFAPKLLGLMRTPEDIIDLSSIYLRIYFFGMIAMMAYNFGAAILRAVGDTKRPLNYLLISGAVNLGLNLLFVIVFKLSVAGVALATIISQWLSAILVLRCLINEEGAIKLNLKELKIHTGELKHILAIGLPSGFQGVVFAISNVTIQSSINSFGSVIVAGNSAAQSLEGFVYMAMNAFHQAAVSFAGQNIGAGKHERIDKIAVRAELLVIATGALFGFLFYVFGPFLLSFYTPSAVVNAAGMERLKVILLTYFLCGMMDVIVGVLRGIGYSFGPMVISLIGACALRLVWLATVFKMEEYHTTTTVYLSYPISWIITFMAQLIMYLIVRRKVIKPFLKKED